MKTSGVLAASALMVFAQAAGAFAQDAGSTKTQDAAEGAKAGIEVELNALAPSQKGCLMTFVARNTLPAAVSKISFELAFFNEKNVVDRITVLDFRDLPVGKKRVRQFDMPGVKCDSITRIIVNDTPVCEGPGPGECMQGLTTRSQLSVPFEG